MTDENQTPDQVTPFAVDEEQEEAPGLSPTEKATAAMYAVSANIIWGDLQLIQGAVNKMIVQTDPEEGALPNVDQYYRDPEDPDDENDPSADDRVSIVLEDIEATAKAVQTWAKKVADRAANLRSLVNHRVKSPT